MTVRKAVRREAARRAFTLMEMLVVVAIIVVLAGIGGYFLLPQLDKSKVQAAKAQAKEVEKALMTYYTDNNAYPQSIRELTGEGGGTAYISSEGIHDPWGQEYQFDPAGNNNGGAKPDVYTKNPKNGELIGNWGK
jgi:general secretion pathway protein G